jgi:4-diphosphocytidyl-2-C-methyl-D-erythritol kinase
MTKLILPAPAKLNLFLQVLNKRPDNYHNIQTVFQFLDYWDDITFSLRKDGDIHLSSTIVDILIEDNIVWKAVRLLKETSECRLGVDIQLTKHLPMGAGIGGGSSDAATTLVALNYLWQLQYSESELLSLAVCLGADVPVFVKGHAAWGESIGEKLTSLELPEPWYVLVIPDCKISTKNLFQDSRLSYSSSLTRSDYFVGQGKNVFESIVCQDYPQVAAALAWLRQFADARMTGTGGIIFGAFDTYIEASKIAARVPKSMQSVVAKGRNQSPLRMALSCTSGWV